MSGSISEIWSGLRDAGMPEVMLFLPDHTASRCHWDETAMIGSIRVALLGDQERKIIRVIPVDSCIGIGVATPKGIDTSCYRGMVQSKLAERFNRMPQRPAQRAGLNVAAVVSVTPGAATATAAATAAPSTGASGSTGVPAMVGNK
jgi:hypothetical protein